MEFMQAMRDLITMLFICDYMFYHDIPTLISFYFSIFKVILQPPTFFSKVFDVFYTLSFCTLKFVKWMSLSVISSSYIEYL